MPLAYAYTLLITAVVLLIALLVGRLAFRLHLPRVTGYLLTGIAVGPSLAHLLGIPTLLAREDLDRLTVVAEIALALILISIGIQFRAENLRRWRQRLAVLSASEIGATFGLVFVATFLLNLTLVGKVLAPASGLAQSSLYIGLFLGVIAVATAPAATLLVIREYESEGPITDAVVTLIGLNNLFAILCFNGIYHFLLDSSAGAEALLGRLFIPILVGGATGLLLSVLGRTPARGHRIPAAGLRRGPGRGRHLPLFRVGHALGLLCLRRRCRQYLTQGPRPAGGPAPKRLCPLRHLLCPSRGQSPLRPTASDWPLGRGVCSCCARPANWSAAISGPAWAILARNIRPGPDRLCWPKPGWP